MLPTHDLKLKSGDELGEFKWSEYQPMKLEDAHHRISIGKLVSESKLAAPQRVQSDTALAKDRHDRGDKCTCVVHRRPGGVNRIAECNTVAASEQQQHRRPTRKNGKLLEQVHRTRPPETQDASTALAIVMNEEDKSKLDTAQAMHKQLNCACRRWDTHVPVRHPQQHVPAELDRKSSMYESPQELTAKRTYP